MLRSLAALSIVVPCLAVAVLSACMGPRAFLKQGDATSAEVAHSGDTEGALRIARQHCARFERVPQLVDTGPDVAYFECVRR
jgi:hypothetical protein